MIMVAVFPQSDSAISWLKANAGAFKETFMTMHRCADLGMATVGEEPPGPPFYLLFTCANNRRHAEEVANDARATLKSVGARETDFKVMMAAE